jgi:hypothetical protein
VDCAWPRRCSSSADSVGEVAGRVHVERERGTSSIRTGTPASSASATWRVRLSGPKLGSIASGGQSTSALVPVPWRSGTIETPGPLGDRGRRGRRAAGAACRPARARRARSRGERVPDADLRGLRLAA